MTDLPHTLRLTIITPPALQIPAYASIDLRRWVLRKVQSFADRPELIILDNETWKVPLFCLFQGEECGKLVFPLWPRCESPLFTDTRDLTITLEGDQLAKVREIDEWAKAQGLEHSDVCFGRACSATEVDGMYTSPIITRGRYAPCLRANMELAGNVKYLTKVTFVRSDGEPEEGSGWEFVEARLGTRQWRGHRARMVLKARIWSLSTSRGMNFGVKYSIDALEVRAC